MNLIKRFIAVILLGASLQTFAGDFPGSKDHPLITRYPGSVIKWYDVQAYTEFKLPVGPVTGYRHIDDWLQSEGRLTRIYYVLKGEKTISEVYLNYLKAIQKAKFQILTKKVHTQNSRSNEVGSFGWLGAAYRGRFPNSAGILLLNGSATIGGSSYIAAKLSRPQGDVYISMAGSQYTQNQIVFMLDILEVEKVEDDLVAVDAEAMAKDLEVYGKVALYGIYFDFDKATIKSESKPALEEIAALLKNRPQLKLYVVGHTDMKGSLDYNVTLSKQRAEAVVKALTKRYGIKTSRLSSRGVGPLVPVMSNQAEKGRAKNRRVELVQM